MRIGLTGPSGSGKTTLANFIKDEIYIKEKHNFLSSHDSRKFVSKETIDNWNKEFNYKHEEGFGHSKLIRLQNMFPKFGLQWQRAMLESRGQFLDGEKNFITDRTFIDNIVYMLTQVSHSAKPGYINPFVETAIYLLNNHFDVIIWVRVADQPEVEDNSRRIPSIIYQKYIDSVFKFVLTEYRHKINTRILTLTEWDLDYRKNAIRDFLL